MKKIKLSPTDLNEITARAQESADRLMEYINSMSSPKAKYLMIKFPLIHAYFGVTDRSKSGVSWAMNSEDEIKRLLVQQLGSFDPINEKIEL
jgi:16S rRNA G527 N7-methylase RsmG